MVKGGVKRKATQKSKSVISKGTVFGILFVVVIMGSVTLLPYATIGMAGIEDWNVDWNLQNGISMMLINGKTYDDKSDFAGWSSLGNLYGSAQVTFNPSGRYSGWESMNHMNTPQGTPKMQVTAGGLDRCDQYGNTQGDNWFAKEWEAQNRTWRLVYFKFDVVVKCMPIAEDGGWGIFVYVRPYASSETMDTTVAIFIKGNSGFLNPDTNIRFQNAFVLQVEDSRDVASYPEWYGDGSWPHKINTANNKGPLNTLAVVRDDSDSKEYTIEVNSVLRCGFLAKYGALGDVFGWQPYMVWIKHTVVFECLVDGPIQEDPTIDEEVDPFDDDYGQTKSNWQVFWDNVFGFFGGYINFFMLIMFSGFILIIVIVTLPLLGRATGSFVKHFRGKKK